ncbi:MULTISPECIES: helix-turn-helix domain-containing protein [unclassified Rhodococcus (in: high G+C Gram-positive bacteria)]|uniref:helix-turn-helix domain-containing protein n=1 Tax=unclassified Rhodococcus (in: high G+C Gram-positive bacteria) TaxID=192944 RepID=UPI001482CF00|nr:MULTISPECIES: helix-turn-helix domain-containing protein [unclassified Rhodococcus (in: high G+C Gram-positive bacteria)]
MVVHDLSTHRRSDRFEVWREVICREFTPLTPETESIVDGGFDARVELRPLGSTNRAVLESVGQRIAHGEKEVAHTGEGVYFVNVQLAGTCRVRTESAGAVNVVPGQFTVVDTTRPYWFDYEGPWRVMSYQVPHSCLAQSGLPQAPTIGRPLDTCAGTGLALTSIMKALWELAPDESTSSGLHLERAFYATVAAVLGETWGTAADSSSAITAAATEYIRTHLGDPELSVSVVARALSVSPRTVHYAFSKGASFATVLREHRLAAIAAVLRDPNNSAGISRIAIRHGMVDASSFSRAFRQQYSMSARDYRAQARRSA